MYYETLAGFSGSMVDASGIYYGENGTFYQQNSLPLHVVPEPSALLALAGGLGGLIAFRRRRAQ